MPSEILLFSGTLLIGFDLVGDFSHLFALVSHYIGRLGNRIAHNAPPSKGKSLLAGVWRFLVRLLLVLLIFAVVITALILLVVWIVGRLLVLVNSQLNKAYMKALDPKETKYISLSRAVMAALRIEAPRGSDEEVWDKIRKGPPFRFVGFLGLVVLSVGFGLQIAGH
jgi:hypothetical protein